MKSTLVKENKYRQTNERFVSQREQPIMLKREAIHLWRPLTTLSSYFISAERLRVIFGIKDRVEVNDITRFIELNKENMKFLDIRPEASFLPCKTGIWLHTGRYAGAIPIKSPQSSLYVLDLAVRGSYSSSLSDEDMYSILTEIDEMSLPEYDDRMRLVGQSLRPPMYYACEAFIHSYENILRSHWQKFRAVSKVESLPRGNTDWSRHACESYDPCKTFRFHNRLNMLSMIHRELMQINYVLDIALGHLEGLSASSCVRKRNQTLIGKLRNMPVTAPKEKVERLVVRSTDSLELKRLKKIGNIILTQIFQSCYAWRLDIAKVFEGYIQAIMQQVAAGWQVKCNPKYPICGKRYSWSLDYLEPDILLRRGPQEVIVDAKYKSHLINKTSINSLQLKESFREDLHQVLAYSSLSTAESKCVVIVYPRVTTNGRLQSSANANSSPTPDETEGYCCKPEQHLSLSIQMLTSPFSGYSCRIFLIGIPFKNGCIRQIAKEFRELLEKSQS